MQSDSKIRRVVPHRPSRAGFGIWFLLAPAILFFLTVNSNAELQTLEQWLDLGWDYFNAGKTDDAFNTFLQAVDKYPESAEARLALAEIYMEKGLTDRAKAEILNALELDKESPIAARGHYLYGYLIREEDTWNALLHFNLTLKLGGSPKLLLDTAHQIRFCNQLIRMPGRSSAGEITLHYYSEMFTKAQADELAGIAQEDAYLAENFCYFKMAKPMHIFLYPSEEDLRYVIATDDEALTPEYREFHVVYDPNGNFIGTISNQIIWDLQTHLNRHAGKPWVGWALQAAIPGKSEIPSIDEPDSQVKTAVDCDEGVRALMAEKKLINLSYLFSDEYAPYIDPYVAQIELGSFLRWIKRSYESEVLQEIITQPNIDIILNEEIDNTQKRWIKDVMESGSLIGNPGNANKWASDLPITSIAGEPEQPTDILKNGLRLYLEGQRASGKREIMRALELDPGMGLGYYSLGWIACHEGEWDKAEEQLTMAVRLLDQPADIAWCHTLLAPIFLNKGRWDLAYASLNIVLTNIDDRNITESTKRSSDRVKHIMTFAAGPIDRTLPEYTAATLFLTDWSNAINTRTEEDFLPKDKIERGKIAGLIKVYENIRKKSSQTVFIHTIDSIGKDGDDIIMKVLIHAVAKEPDATLLKSFEPFTTEGYPIFLKIGSSGEKYGIVDWEDGWFPLSSIKYYRSIDLGAEKNGTASPAKQ